MTALLAPDPAVPQRDALLDERRIADLFGADRAERVNTKYRVGDSLRVAYRIEAGGATHTVAGRTFTGRSESVYRDAASALSPGPRPAVLHAAELETVFWRFPNDRRLSALWLFDGHSHALDRLVGHPVATTRVVAYSPERAATAQCLDGAGRVLAYVKLHWDSTERERAAAEATAAAVGTDDPHLRLPRVIAATPDTLALEPLAGERLDGLAELVPALHRLGAALARFHRIPQPARRFERLDEAKLVAAADVLTRARPDCHDTAASLLARLRAGPAAGEPVHLHGDANLRNALLDGRRIALVDLEDAAAGPAAADLGSVLAGLVAAHAQGRITAARRAALTEALLGGYGRPPAGAELRWHTAACVLARVAVPAVGRVRPTALAHLEPLLRAAEELLP